MLSSSDGVAGIICRPFCWRQAGEEENANPTTEYQQPFPPFICCQFLWAMQTRTLCIAEQSFVNLLPFKIFVPVYQCHSRWECHMDSTSWLQTAQIIEEIRSGSLRACAESMQRQSQCGCDISATSLTCWPEIKLPVEFKSESFHTSSQRCVQTMRICPAHENIRYWCWTWDKSAKKRFFFYRVTHCCFC